MPPPDPAPEEHLVSDLRQIVLQTVAEQRKQQELAPILKRSQKHLESMFRSCRGKAERMVLRRCLQPIEVGGVSMVVPRRAVDLNAEEVLMLMERGFRLGKVDPHFEVRVIQQQRVPYWKGEPLPHSRWKDRFACLLKHEGCTGLVRAYRAAQQAVEEANTAGASPTSARSKLLREALEEEMFRFRVPTRFDLESPPKLMLERSVLLEEQGQTLESQLPERARQTLKLQQQQHIPSLLRPGNLRPLRRANPSVIILLDISSSTFERDLFKMANLACASLMETLRALVPKISLRVIPYSDSALKSFEKFDGFVPPGGTTAYEAAFAAALGFLEKWSGDRTVIHLTDGLPNSLELARESAGRLQESGVEYGQVIFGHTKRVGDLADYLQRDTRSEPGRYERYLECFTSVAEACGGSQVVLWVMERLPEVVLSLTDLVLWCHFLERLASSTSEASACGVSLEERNSEERGEHAE